MMFRPVARLFLSTLSLRRATRYSLRHSAQSRHFYPRSPCGERLNKSSKLSRNNGISIHALLAESDVVHALKLANTMLFLSTLSLRRATDCGQYCIRAREISIHALLAESDNTRAKRVDRNIAFLSTLSLRRATSKRFPPMCFIRHFYPRSPCGERQLILIISQHSEPFLSTLSLRRATRPNG